LVGAREMANFSVVLQKLKELKCSQSTAHTSQDGAAVDISTASSLATAASVLALALTSSPKPGLTGLGESALRG